MIRGPHLIVGASRGIGAELVRQYVDAGELVHATVRDATAPGQLDGLDGGLQLHELDVRDVAKAEALASDLAGAELGIVIHNAGIYRGHTRADMMEVNAAAPIRMVENLLEAGAVRSGGVVALMTSQMGARRGATSSLGDYGDSKAALNDGFRSRATDWAERGVLAIVIHPGWVKTDMGGAGASLTVADSVLGIRRLIADLTPDQHGRFWTWDGREHPW